MKYFIKFCLLLLCSSIALAQPQLLTNPGFEGSFTNVASGWHQITYGISLPPVVSYGKETVVKHAGSSSQRIAVNSLGDGATLLVQDFDFTAGNIFEGSIWLHASDSMKIIFMFQERVPFYHVPAIYIKKIGPSWEKLTIKGGYKRNVLTNQPLIEGRFVIQPLDTGTLYVDESSLTNITDTILNDPVSNSNAIPSNYFGMHVNKLGIHQTYPAVGIGAMRLWDTGTDWQTIEPTQGLLSNPSNWIYDSTGLSGFGFRLDYYVNYILSHDSAASILYTMGQTPSWAATNSSLPPLLISDWQNYVNILGNRYAGVIKYWEVWNEADYNGSYSGSADELVLLSQTAYQELKNIDSANTVLSPNFTSAQGLAEFLYSSGGNYADYISWHNYPSKIPEESIPEIIGILNVMENYGCSSKPLWNTEGAVSSALTDTLTMAEGIAAVSRAYISQWLFGIENFNWYCWDVYGDFSHNFTELSYSAVPHQYDSIAPPGIAYRETVTWLKGAQVVSKSVNNNTWVVELQRPGGYHAWIVWNTTGSQSFNIPALWNITSIRDLYADTLTAIPSVIQISQLPLLLENNFAVGMADTKNENRATIFPNPSHDKLTIHCVSGKINTVELLTVTGQLIALPENTFENEQVIDVKNLDAGVYFIKIYSDNKCWVRKFVKM